MKRCQYAELAVMSNFSFLRGASHPEELVQQASQLGYRAMALCDQATLAGMVRAHAAAKEAGLPLLVGCRLHVSPEAVLLVYPQTRAAYGRLCSLLTLGNQRSRKGSCRLQLEDLQHYHKDLVVVALFAPEISPADHRPLGQAALQAFSGLCEKLCDLLPARSLLSLASVRNYGYQNSRQEALLKALAQRLNLARVALNDVSYHHPARRMLHDVLCCIREKCTIAQAGFGLQQNAERFLKTPAEMQRLFRDDPAAIHRGLELAEMLSGFSLDQLRYEYPDAVCPPGLSPHCYLTQLVQAGAQQRYPQGVPAKVQDGIHSELALIQELNYEKYFLTCYDIVRFARERGILCQGRGAAANSIVCFCLGITSVDPAKIDLLFARFVSKERSEPPDIDIDFEHERREEVIQYIYQKYGRSHAALTAEVITYRPRSALREVGKALGLPLETVDRLARSVHRWTSHAISAETLATLGLNVSAHTVQNLFMLAHELLSFPRHLSQHVGGFIISHTALSEIVPILKAGMEQRTIIEWDKDDIETLGMLKIDVLGLGMLSCIRKALDAVNARHKTQALTLAAIPPEDPRVYDMICEADTIGVFQIESRAQMSMLPRLKPRRFYDLVIEVAIVRPGPIQGNMVHPYLKRRNGLEPICFPDERVAQILGKTLGVPLFQEQAMRLAITLAGFSPGEAEQLRRAMAAWKKDKGKIATFQSRILAGMQRHGYTVQFAESCVQQIKGFSEYGFPESHAASFALLVYASAWLKRFYPSEFFAALLNSQPMGFYAPSQIIQDAQRHAVLVLPIDVNESTWWTRSLDPDDSQQRPPALRLGLHLVRGLAKEQAARLEAARAASGKCATVLELWQKSRGSPALRRSTLEVLARANAFTSMGLTQRQALWEIKALPAELYPLDFHFAQRSSPVPLPELTRQQSMFQDYEMTGFSLQAHPISFIRSRLIPYHVQSARALQQQRAAGKGHLVSAAGIVIFRQRPGTAKGIVFITLEDESGIMNLIIRPAVFDTYQAIVLSSACLLARGFLEFVGKQVYLNVEQLKSLDDLLLEGRRSRFPERSYSY